MGIYTKNGAAILSHNLSGKRGRFENLLGKTILIAITLVLILMSPARVMAQTDATLSNLTISSGALTPVFDGSLNYTAADVPNATANITVTPTTTDINATVTINGNPATSGGANPVALNVGGNTITVVVTSADVSTNQTYTIAI